MRPFLSLSGVKPLGPEEFEDFWGWGVAAAVGVEQPVLPGLHTQYSVEVSRFPLELSAAPEASPALGDPAETEISAVYLLALRFGIRATPRDLQFWAMPYLLATTGFVWAFDPKLTVTGSEGSEQIRFPPNGLNAVHALGVGLEVPLPGSRFVLSVDARILAALSGASPIRYLPIRATLSRSAGR
jgi:hypothetical protein